MRRCSGVSSKESTRSLSAQPLCCPRSIPVPTPRRDTLDRRQASTEFAVHTTILEHFPENDETACPSAFQNLRQYYLELIRQHVLSDLSIQTPHFWETPHLSCRPFAPKPLLSARRSDRRSSLVFPWRPIQSGYQARSAADSANTREARLAPLTPLTYSR